MKLQVDSVDILPNLKEEFEDMAFEIVGNHFESLLAKYIKKKEMPRYMNKKQACQYLNTSFTTLTKKYIPNGLRVIEIDGEEKIDQVDADEFMEEHKKIQVNADDFMEEHKK